MPAFLSAVGPRRVAVPGGASQLLLLVSCTPHQAALLGECWITLLRLTLGKYLFSDKITLVVKIVTVSDLTGVDYAIGKSSVETLVKIRLPVISAKRAATD